MGFRAFNHPLATEMLHQMVCQLKLSMNETFVLCDVLPGINVGGYNCSLFEHDACSGPAVCVSDKCVCPELNYIRVGEDGLPSTTCQDGNSSGINLCSQTRSCFKRQLRIRCLEKFSP